MIKNREEGNDCEHCIDLRSCIKEGGGVITFFNLSAISLSKTSDSEFS
jgi:hypothetical protein